MQEANRNMGNFPAAAEWTKSFSAQEKSECWQKKLE
jgi:hypothetical protein